MPLPFDIDPFGPQVPPADVPPWAGPVPMPPEWGPLDVPPQGPADAAPAPPGPDPSSWVPPDLTAQSAPPDVVPHGLQPGLPIPTGALDAAGPPPMPQPGPEAPPERSWFHDPRWEASHDTLDNESAWNESVDPLAAGNAQIALDAQRSDYTHEHQKANLDREAQAAQENNRILHESNARTQKELAEIDADYKKLVNENVGWASKSAPQKIAGFISAVVGGLVQSRTGGARNTGMDMIDKIIDGEVAEHRAKIGDLRDRRKDIAAQFGQHLDTYRTEEAMRQSMYELTARQIENDASNLDPRGTQHAKRLALATDVRQRAAAARAAAEEKLFDRNIKSAKQALDERAQLATERQNKSSNALGWANNANATQRLAYDKTKDERDYGIKVREVTAKETEEARKVTEAGEKANRELGVGGATQTTTVKQQVPDPVTGKTVERDVTVSTPDQLRSKPKAGQKVGDIWHAPDPAARALLVKQASGNQDLVNSATELKRLREANGGANNWTSPGVQADFKQLVNRAVVAAANSKGQSLADEQSFNQYRDALFGADPSKYRVGDVEKRIESAMADGTRSYHAALKFNGYDGKLPSFDRPAAEAGLSTAEGASKEVQQGKTSAEAASDATPGALGKLNPFGSQGFLNPNQKSEQQLQEQAFNATDSPEIPGLSVDQAAGVKALLAQSRSPELDTKAKDAARQELVNLATIPGREALHTPMLRLLEDESPELFDAALTKLPKGEREQWSGYAAIRRRGK